MFFCLASLFQEGIHEEAASIYSMPAFIRISPAELPLGERDFLLRIAKDTFKYFWNICDVRTGLVLDHIVLKPAIINAYTASANIGFQLLCVSAAADLGIVERKAAAQRIEKILLCMKDMKKWHGFFYDYYLTGNAAPSSRRVSVMSNVWIYLGLVFVAEFFPELAKQAFLLANAMDFSVFYDAENGQFRLYYDEPTQTFSKFHYGLLCTESRLLSFVAIGKGDVPEEHYFCLYRTLPTEWRWQRQRPFGGWVKYREISVFEGYYMYKNIKIVPSWGGSLFEFLVPTLFIDEIKYAPESLGENDKRAVEVHIKFAQEKHFPVWGFSPCSVPTGTRGEYEAYGVADIGCKGYENYNVVSPYSSALALYVNKKKAIKNLRKMVSLGLYGPYGFYDSYDFESKVISPRYFAQDQAFVFLSVYNVLTGGKLRKIFHKLFPKVAELISIEKFGYRFPAFVSIPLSELPSNNKKFLERVARDTFKYFENYCDSETGFVYDTVVLRPSPEAFCYTNITNIGLELACIYGACRLGFIERSRAIGWIRKIVAGIKSMKKWKGFPYNYYMMEPLKGERYIGPSSLFVSSVDSAWLCVGLVVAQKAFPEIEKDIKEIIQNMNFSVFYNPELGQFSLGYSFADGKLLPYHYGLICTEARIIPYIAICKGDVPIEALYKMGRTLPPGSPQRQKPRGVYVDYPCGFRVFESYYNWEDIEIVPSWGGSLFEFLMPTLFVDELKVAPDSFGENDKRAVKVHIEYATKKLGYPVWGLSPCSTPDGSLGAYHEYGVAEIGCYGYESCDVVTPHVVALSLYCYPRKAIKTLKKYVELGMYGEYGFYDSYNVSNKQISPRYLALDQGMIFLSIYNYLTGGDLRRVFHSCFPKLGEIISDIKFGYMIKRKGGR